MICTDSKESIEIPEEQELFGYVRLNLLGNEKGAGTCKACNRIYEADQLKSVALGVGKGPFQVNVRPPGGIGNLFPRTKRGNLSMFGGQGFECPNSHPLISMSSWMT
jgi:hypothetical protein